MGERVELADLDEVRFGRLDRSQRRVEIAPLELDLGQEIPGVQVLRADLQAFLELLISTLDTPFQE